MARIQIPFSFSFPLSCFVSSASGSFTSEAATVTLPVVAAAVTITSRTTLSPATVYQAETGPSTYTSIVTDSGGNVPGWVDPGSYKIVVAPQGSFSGATLNFDAVRGDGVTNIAAGVVDTTQLSSGVNTTLGYVRPPFPVGSVMHYLGSTDPIDADGQTRWLIMDGRQTLSRTTYATLFSLIGTTYGGSGSTFGIPDARGRTVIGAGAGSGLTSRALGATGGEETHLLSITEMPSHNHGGATGGANTGTDFPDHTHNYTIFTQGAVPSGPIAVQAVTAEARISGGANQRHQHGIPGLSISGQGGGAVHNNMQPFFAANHIVKVLA